MSEIRIADRYAKSLVMLAKEQGKLDTLVGDMKQFADMCKQSTDLSSMLKSPVITGDRKFSVLKKVFGSSFDPLTVLFIETVVRKGRERYLPIIAKEFVRQYNEMNNIATATVTTAIKLNDAAYADIKKDLETKTGKSIELKTVVDPAIIGGLIVRMDDNLYDASIAKKLKKIKLELVLN